MKNNKTAVWLLSAIGLLIFCYVTIRAAVLAFTWDESYTFLEFVRKDFFTPDGSGVMMANNHRLNTWLMKLMSAWLGDSEFSLRLPNVLSYLLFAYYSAKLSLKFRPFVFVVSSFLILNLNPFLLDFFSLARGYGLSMGFMMGSLFYLHQFSQERDKTKYAVISLLFCAASVLANFPLMNYLFAILFIIVSLLFHFQYANGNLFYRKNFAGRLLVICIAPIALLCYSIPLSFEMKKAGALYYGGEKNFWSDTLHSCVKVFLYEKSHHALVPMLKIFILIIIITAVFLIVHDARKKTLKMNSFLLTLLSLLSLCSVSIILQRWIFSTPYLIERTAMLFFPLFALLLVFLLKRVSEIDSRWMWAAPLICLLLLIHFAQSMNFYFVQQWKEDADVKSVIEYVEKNHSLSDPDRNNIVIGTDFIFDPEVNYYRTAKNITWLNKANNEDLSVLDNFFFLGNESGKIKEMDSVQLLRSFPETGNKLFRNLKTPKSKEILFTQKVDFESQLPAGQTIQTIHDRIGYNSQHSTKTDAANRFSHALVYSFDSAITGKNLLVVFNTMIFAEETHFDAMAVFQIDSYGKTIYWRNADVKDFIHQFRQWYPLRFSSALPEQIQPGDILKVYIWNIGKGSVCVDDMEVKIIAYSF